MTKSTTIQQHAQRVRYDTCHTANQTILLPDLRIKEDKPEYVYVPLRGYSYLLAVFNMNDRPIGWIRTETLGYNSVKDWIEGTKWVDKGY